MNFYGDSQLNLHAWKILYDIYRFMVEIVTDLSCLKGASGGESTQKIISHSA